MRSCTFKRTSWNTAKLGNTSPRATIATSTKRRFTWSKTEHECQNHNVMTKAILSEKITNCALKEKPLLLRVAGQLLVSQGQTRPQGCAVVLCAMTAPTVCDCWGLDDEEKLQSKMFKTYAFKIGRIKYSKATATEFIVNFNYKPCSINVLQNKAADTSMQRFNCFKFATSRRYSNIWCRK